MKFREGLMSRIKKSYDKRETTGRFKTIFRDDLEIQVWPCPEGDHLIDIIPYLAGNNDPDVEPGSPTYCLDVWVHPGVGVNENSYICLSRTYNKPCPICEYQKKLRMNQNADYEALISLNPVRRTLYNIVCYDNEKEKEKGVQVWQIAHWYFERFLVALARDPRTGRIICFADPEEGKSIAFTKKGKGRNMQIIGHRFVDRSYEIPKEILDSAYILDEIIHVPTYEEVKEAFEGVSLEEISKPKEKIEEEPKGKEYFDTEGQIEPPKEKEEKPSRKLVCPFGGKFGEDIDNLEECINCPFYEKCALENERLKRNEK